MGIYEQYKRAITNVDVPALSKLIEITQLDFVLTGNMPILHYVIRRGGVVFEQCQLQMLAKGFPHDEPDGIGITPLIYAAQFSTTSVVKAILDLGVYDIDLPHSVDLNKTALMYAFSRDQVEMAELLMQGGAEPNVVNANRIPAHHYAKSPGCKSLLENLTLLETLKDGTVLPKATRGLRL